MRKQDHCANGLLFIFSKAPWVSRYVIVVRLCNGFIKLGSSQRKVNRNSDILIYVSNRIFIKISPCFIPVLPQSRRIKCTLCRSRQAVTTILKPYNFNLFNLDFTRLNQQYHNQFERVIMFPYS